MFWGLIIEPYQRYTQIVDKSFHVSMASLDAATANTALVQVMLCYGESNYLLCTLRKDSIWQVPLDLNFQEGTKIAFTSNGCGNVHLTGYLIPEEEDDLDLDELEEEEEDDDEEVPQLVANQPKRKANESPKDNKKAKRLKGVVRQDESSDDVENELRKYEEEEDEESAESSEEGDSDDDDDDEDDEEDEEDESEDEVEEKIEVKPRQNKNKQKEQQPQQQKQEKQKLVNGKNVKKEETKLQTKKNKKEQQQKNAEQVPKKRIVEGGVQIDDVKLGTGTPATSGKFVSVYYVGRLNNGKKFDSTTQGDGFKFRLGKGEVIKGWDVGILGMKVGGKRRITIPPNFAYGAKGSPPTIPGNSTLVFEVELKNVH